MKVAVFGGSGFVGKYILKIDADDYIDNLGGDFSLNHKHFTYYLKILNIQDSIATAKITGSVFPFAYPQLGDEINIK